MIIDYYLIVKAIHIIFMVSYFAGVFYIVRLFIYHTEVNTRVNGKIVKDQFLIMEKKLWDIIIVPAGSIMLITGITMLWSNAGLLQQTWMHVKLLFVVCLFLYHGWIWRTLLQLKKDKFNYTSVQLRLYNEVATLILFVVVFAVTLKSYFLAYWYWVLISFFLIGIIILFIVKITNREKK